MTSNTKISAQYINPNITDNYPSGQNQVAHTGNAAITYDNSRNLRVMVWDGNSPGFYFEDDYNNLSGEFDLDGVNIGNVVDPDIVLGRDNNVYAFIVYLIGDSVSGYNVYYEVWEYDGVDWSLSVNATQVTSNQESNCPNVDILPDLYRLAFVYEEQGSIMGYSYNILTQNLGPQTQLVEKGKEPDVSCFVYGTYPSQIEAYNITYLEQNGNNLLLREAYDVYQNLIQSNAIPSANIITLGIANSSQAQYFGRPRIASAIDPPPPSIESYQIVVEYYDGIGKHKIYSYNKANTNSPYLVNENPGCLYMSAENSHSPVVSYAGDQITVAWVYDDDQYSTYGTSTTDILARQLYSQNGMGSNVDYTFQVISQVNSTYTGTQNCPSVCGRYTFTDQCLITFFNENTNEIGFKNVAAGSYQYRKPAIDQSLLYPNPANENITIQMDAKLVGGFYEIYNSIGILVDKNSITSSNFKLGLSDYQSGLYFIKLYSTTYSETRHFEILK